MAFVEITSVKLNMYFVERRVKYEKEISMGTNFLPKLIELLSSIEEKSLTYETETYSYGEEYARWWKLYSKRDTNNM